MLSRRPFTFSKSLRPAVNFAFRSSNILTPTYRQSPLYAHPALQSYGLRYYAFGTPRRPQYNRFNRARTLFHSSPAFRYTTLAAASGFVIFIVSNIEQVPESGRWRFNCVSEDFERRNGDATYRMVMGQYRRQFIRSSDQRCRMVGRVLQRLVEGGNLKGDWEYHVIQGEEKNAFVVPGWVGFLQSLTLNGRRWAANVSARGKVFVFSGILSVCENDAGLATVLSHEIAHNMAHHVQERLSIPYLLQPIAWVASLLLGDTGGIANIFLGLTFQLPNSRAQEVW